jgi:ribosomal protein S18 acetylase RimI-like enzyme
MNAKIRKVSPNDVLEIKKVIDSTQLFPSELLDEMIQPYFTNPNSNEIWLTSVDEHHKPIAVAYCAPEKLTVGTFNLYLIAVRVDYQNKGVGKEIMIYLENFLKQQNERVLIVETSSLEEFDKTRRFYDKCNYIRQAVIKDFYQDGEDKIIFWKKLKS